MAQDLLSINIHYKFMSSETERLFNKRKANIISYAERAYTGRY